MNSTKSGIGNYRRTNNPNGSSGISAEAWDRIQAAETASREQAAAYKRQRADKAMAEVGQARKAGFHIGYGDMAFAIVAANHGLTADDLLDALEARRENPEARREGGQAS